MNTKYHEFQLKPIKIMNNKQFIYTLALAATVLFSCKDKTEDPKPTIDTTPQWEANVTSSDMRVHLDAQNLPGAATTITSSTGGSVNANGISATVPADAFANADGSPYNGNVILKIKTITNTADMLKSGITTVNDSGDLLISAGMFKLEAFDAAGTNPLKLRNGVKYSSEFTGFDINNKVFEGVAAPGGNNKIVWEEWDSTDIKRGQNSVISGLDKLFTWCNLDRYMNEKPLTDITITTPNGFTNKNTECFMKYTGENATAYIPANSSLKAFSTQGGYYKVVVGRAAKILCFAKRDGKFYYDIQTIGAITINQTLAISTMTETTEANLNTVIAGF